jgi:hypothetical protein
MGTSLRCVRLLLFLVLALMLFLPAHLTRAESDLEKALRQYNFNAVKGYIQPVADLFGANMNTGYYHSAAIPTAGFHLSFKIIAMGSMVSDDQKSYNIVLPAGFVPTAGTSLKTATVFGDKGTLFTDATTGFSYRGSDGIVNTSLFPLAVPQLTIGSVYGTEASVRFVTIPEIDNGKFPKTTLWGIGGRHSISQYIQDAPLDIAVGINYGKFTVGDFIDLSALSFGAQASKEFSVLTLYGGIQSEKSTMNLKYTSTDPTAPPAVDIDLDAANTFRFTLGAGLNLGVFKLFGDANFGSVTTLSVGFGFGG